MSNLSLGAAAKNGRGKNGKASATGAAVQETKATNRAVAAKPTHEEIALRAFQIYQREGCPEGRADEHWALAEAELTG